MRTFARGNAQLYYKVKAAMMDEVVRLRDERAQAHAAARAADERFALAILALREQGCSVRVLASKLGIGASTVHDWTRRGRALKG